MRKKRYTLTPFLSLLLFTLLSASCGDDDNYVYPPVLTEFVDAYVNSASYIDKIVTDQGETLLLENNVSAKELQTDSYYRALCMYERIDTQSNQAKAYSLKLVFSSTPIPSEKFIHGVKTDPLSVQSIWRGRNYLNIIVLPKAQNITHSYHFIEDSVVTREGITKVYLKLYHDRNNDLEAYEQKTYLSVPLHSYSMQKGDSIYFRVNTYKEGLKTWKFAY